MRSLTKKILLSSLVFTLALCTMLSIVFISNTKSTVKADATYSIGEIISTRNNTDGWGHKHLGVRTDTEILNGTPKEAYPQSQTGFLLNGADMAVGKILIYYGSNVTNFMFFYETTDVVPGLNGYSHATIEVKQGASMTYNGTTYTLNAKTFYLDNGAWTTTKPTEYHTSVELEKEFTNNGQFEINASDKTNIGACVGGTKPTLTYVDAESEGLTGVGATGTVLKVNKVLDAYSYFQVDVTASQIKANKVESVVVRVYIKGGGTNDTFRTNAWQTGNSYYGNRNIHTGFVDITLDSTSMTNWTLSDGTLGKIVLFAEIKSTAEYMYIDSITINIKEPISVYTVGDVFDNRNNTSGWGHQHLALLTDAPILDGTKTEAYAKAQTGITFNGEKLDISRIFFWYKNSATKFIFFYETGDVVAGANGYSHATIEIAQGATVTYGGNTYEFNAKTFYLDNGLWTTNKPTGYKVVDASALENEFTNNGQFVIKASGETNIGECVGGTKPTLTYVNAEEEGLTGVGATGAVLKINKVLNAYSYFQIDVTASNIKANLVESVVIRAYIKGGNSTDTLRTNAWQNKDDEAYNVSYDNGNIHTGFVDITLSSASINHWTVENGNLGKIVVLAQIKSSAEYMYIDSITFSLRDKPYFDTEFVGINNESTLKRVVLDFNDEGVWDNDLGNLTNYVYLDATKTLNEDGGTIEILENKKIAINIVGNYKTLAIEDGATCGGAKISGFVLYADVSTFKVNPVSPTVSFKGTPKDWNNRPDKNGYTYLILEYTNKLSNVEDKINLASDTKYEIATNLTINGVAINEIYKSDPKTVLDYAGYGYLRLYIHNSFLTTNEQYKYNTLEIANNTPFEKQVLPAIKLYLVDKYWFNFEKWSVSAPKIDDYEYAFAVVGDTQRVNYYYPDQFSIIYDWLVNNAESKKIKYVIGLGDITDKDEEAEWNRAKAGFEQLYGIGLDHIQVRGNHDTSASFEAFFSADTNYTGSIVGSYNGMMANSYKLVSVGDVKYLMLALDYGADDNVLAWADSVVESYPTYNVIVITHGYLDRDGSVIDKQGNLPPSLTGGVNDGIDIWNKFVSKHENIIMVLSGHVYCDNIVTSTQQGKNGNTVTQFLIDPQQMDMDEVLPTEMIALFYFSKDGKKLQVQYYSPILDLYEITSPITTFTLDVVSNLPKTELNAIGETSQTNNSNYLELYFTDENSWTDDAGNIADKILLDNVTLSSIGGSVVKGDGKTLKISWTGDYSALKILWGASFAGNTFSGIDLYFVEGVWTTEKPDMLFTIGDVFENRNNTSGWGRIHLGLTTDAPILTDAKKEAYPTAQTGLKRNGMDLPLGGLLLYYKDGKTNFIFLYDMANVATGLYGYSHATIEIAQGATVTYGGETYTFNAKTFYLDNGAWTTTKPIDYQIVVPTFTVGDVFENRNNTSGWGHMHLALKTDAPILTDAKKEAYPTAQTGFSLNGKKLLLEKIFFYYKNEMTNLIFFYETADVESGVNGYSHATIKIAQGATVSYGGKTFKFNAKTLYLDNGLWTTTEPSGYSAPFETEFIGVDSVSTLHRVVLNFTDNVVWTSDLGNLANCIYLDATTTLAVDGGSIEILGGKKIALNLVGNYKTISIVDGATCGGAIIKAILLYADDTTFNVTPQLSTVLYDKIPPDWNNRSDKDGYKYLILEFSSKLGVAKNNINQASDLIYPIATNLTINGVAINEIYKLDPKTVVSYGAGSSYLRLYIHESFLTTNAQYKYTTLEILENTPFESQVLPAVKMILFGGYWINSKGFNPQELEFTGIAGGWNNRTELENSSTILQYGEWGVNFLGPETSEASHGDATNLANKNSQIGSKLTLNGKPIKDYEGVTVSYLHGYNYVYISIPKFYLAPSADYPAPTLNLEDKTVFLSSVLSGLTLYLVNGEWTVNKPETIVNDLATSYTVSDLFQENKLVLSGETVKSAVVSNTDDFVFKFLFNTAVSDFAYELRLGDGLAKVLFFGNGNDDDLKQNISLYVNGKTVLSVSVLMDLNENFAIRISSKKIGNDYKFTVAVDGVVFINHTTQIDAFTNNIQLVNGLGDNQFSDFKSGDIKAPTISWQGKKLYKFKAGEIKPSDEKFRDVMTVTDNVDFSTLSSNDIVFTWQKGAVVNGKLVEGSWFITASITDSSNNTTSIKINVLVEEENVFTVTFDGENPVQYQKGDLVVKPSDPVKEDDEKGSYVFDGWFFNGVKWNFDEDYVTRNINLEARFKITPKFYKVTVTTVGLEENISYSLTLAYGATLEKTLFNKEGYNYSIVVSDSTLTSIIVTEDMDVKVVYTKIAPPDNPDNPEEPTPPKKSGCGSTFTATEFGVLFTFLAVAFVVIKISFKKKENENE